jgi:hypothetical protein
VAFAPDGQALASASRDGTVKLWKRHGPDWREEVTLDGGVGPLRSVAFAPGGQALAAAAEGRAVRLWRWDGQAWRQGPALKGHKGPIHALAYSSDGKQLASAGGTWPEVNPGEVKVWDARTGQPLASLEGHEKNVNGVAFSPDGRTVATASADYTVRLWDATTGKHRATLYAADGCNGVAFSPDGQALAAGCGDRSVWLWKWDGAGWRRDKILRTHGGAVWGVAFSRDGKALASAGFDKTARLYDVRTGEELATLRGHTHEVVCVALSADGLLATGSWDGTVKLWDVAGPAAGAGQAERPAATPFVVLGRAGKVERPFATLAEAVAAAQAGDTVEVRGDGPFVSPPVFVRKALTIRAGEGARPVLELGPAYVKGTVPLLEATAPLVLEGLELRRVGKERYQSGRLPRILFAQRAPLRAANCRLVGYPDCAAILTDWSPVCELRNCEFLGDGRFARADHYLPHGGRLVLANNVMLGGEFGAAFHYAQPDLADIAVELTRNTVVAETPLALFLDKLPAPRAPAANPPARPVRLKASGNVLDGGLQVLEFFQPAELPSTAGPQRANESQARLGQLVAWSEQNNVYPKSVNLLTLYGRPPEPLPAGKGLADWSRFWGVKDAASVRGEIRYRGGDLRARAATQPEQVAAEDFRLQAGSPGHGAAKGGLDLGADVDLVGPGPAYERWKKTPEYRQWLQDTGQAKAEQPALPFVVLGRGGQAERPFATLAEAVAAAQAGDTVEVRGDGPFVSPPVFVGKALTIRAGKGARPVIELAPAQAQADVPLLETSAPLVLEGLELRRVGKKYHEPGPLPKMIAAHRAPLRAANCRFVAYPDCVAVFADWSPLCEVRNCAFLSDGMFARVDHRPPHGGRLVLANNVMLGGGFGAAFHYAQPDLADVAVELTRNTLAVETPVGFFLDTLPAPRAPGGDAPAKPIRLKASGNLLDGQLQVLELRQGQDLLSRAGPLGEARDAQALLGRLVAWSEQNNVYPEEVGLLGLYVKSPQPLPAGKSLADWGHFWGVKDTAAVRGRVRYRGGALRSRAFSQLEQVTAGDFRLRAGSPGHRAAKGGHDLGADVDLVGPGPAYERWQKTPEYRQWLKDTRAGR